MKRFIFLLTVAAVMAAMLVFSGVANAEPTSCLATANANPEGGGNAEPGQTGDRARSAAERNHERLGQGTAFAAQLDIECSPISESGPPGAFDPQTN